MGGRAAAWRRGGCITMRQCSCFVGVYEAVSVKGSLVADAYLAALAMEHRAEWVTTDRDFARFPGLRWRHPLDPPA